MSDALSIAALTATIRRLLEKGVTGEGLGPDDITAKPLDKARNGSGSSKQINLFLYQTVPNAALNNMDMPGRTRPGEETHPPLALDLRYLITAYGDNDNDLSGHRLLGKAMSVLHDHPVLGREEIENALPESNLSEQVERIRITPQTMSLDEMSKLWNTFQTQYRISAAYQLSVVLIESTRTSRTPLPVLSRGSEDQGVTTVAEPSPSLSEIKLPNSKPGAELGDELIIRGGSLGADDVVVRFEHSLLRQPIELAAAETQLIVDGKPETALRVKLPTTADDPHAPSKWPIGFYTLTVVVQKPQVPPWTTNALSFALVPTTELTDPTPPPTPPEVDAGDLDLKLNCVPQIRAGQRVELLFGDRVFGATDVASPNNPTAPSELEFKVLNAEPRDAPYTLRVRVDGVDSIPVDFSQSPPRFDPKLQIKVNQP